MDKRGFSLIEILIVCGIIATMGSVLVGIVSKHVVKGKSEIFAEYVSTLNKKLEESKTMEGFELENDKQFETKELAKRYLDSNQENQKLTNSTMFSEVQWSRDKQEFFLTN